MLIFFDEIFKKIKTFCHIKISNIMGDEIMRIKKSVVIVLVIVLLGVTGIGANKAFKNNKKPIENNEENISLKGDNSKEENPEPNPPETEEPIKDEEDEPQIDSVPLQEEIADTYFDDAVFIGDSRTEGFMIYENVDAKFYTHKGLMVDTIFTNPVITEDGEKITIMDALAKDSFNKVYIMLGINETGWQSSSLFIKKYGEIIDSIKKINPNAIIYVESILPVSEEVSLKHDYIKMSKINEYNDLLKEMAKEKDVYYLDISSSVANEQGYLLDDAATDGIHLNKNYCDKWLQYLKTHYIVEN